MHQRGRGAGGVAALLALAMAAGVSCSTSYDTKQVSSGDSPSSTASPRTSVVVGTTPTTTTIAPFVADATLASTGGQATLSALVSRFAMDPALLGKLGQAGPMDLSSLAGLVGIDPTAIKELGMTVEQINSIGKSVASSPGAVQQRLIAAAGGEIDPAILVGLLTSSIDTDALATGAIGALVKALVGSIGNLDIEINPQLNIKLSELLKELDPNASGPAPVDPANASLVALLTSAFISANPLLTEQLLSNPLLDPALKDLLVQLQGVSATLSDVATAALLNALAQVFPGLVP